MKKVFFISIFLILICFTGVSNAIVTNSSTYSNVKAYVLYNEENDLFKEQKEWLDKNLDIRKEYINTNENNELYQKIKDVLKIKKDKFPLIIIGSSYFVNFDDKVQNNIKEAEKAYKNAKEYGDIVEKLKNNEDVKEVIKQNEKIYKNKNTFNVIIKVVIIVIAVLLVIVILNILLKKKLNKTTNNSNKK